MKVDEVLEWAGSEVCEGSDRNPVKHFIDERPTLVGVASHNVRRVVPGVLVLARTTISHELLVVRDQAVPE